MLQEKGMNMKEAVFIFTKGKKREYSLNLLISKLKDFDCKKFLINDSCINESPVIIKNKNTGKVYITEVNYKNYTKYILSLPNEIQKYVKPIGIKWWNTGNARNLALIIAKIEGITKIIFIDDDILLDDKTIVEDYFKMLDNYGIISAEIIGMRDDSIIGNIENYLHGRSQTFFSAGFMGINITQIHYPFINCYNEDWIWAHLHKNRVKMVKHKCVTQLDYNPFSYTKEKIKLQEIGECLLKGIEIIDKLDELYLLNKSNFWENILLRRQAYLQELKCFVDDKQEFLKIIEKSIQITQLIKADYLSQICSNYLRYSRIFNEFILMKN